MALRLDNPAPADALQHLVDEAELRRLMARYMRLCDVPLPDPDLSEPQRVAALADLFCEDGVWEGVGDALGARFGRRHGRAEIEAHFRRFFIEAQPRLVFNCHFLTSEHLEAGPDGAEGLWVQFQPWVFDDGQALLKSSRLRCRFRREGSRWRIRHYRTESLFVAPLPPDWASSLTTAAVLMRTPMEPG